MMVRNSIFLPPDPPFLHRLKVKEVLSKKGLKIGKNNISLYFFLSFTPTPSRYVFLLLFLCV